MLLVDEDAEQGLAHPDRRVSSLAAHAHRDVWRERKASGGTWHRWLHFAMTARRQIIVHIQQTCTTRAISNAAFDTAFRAACNQELKATIESKHAQRQVGCARTKARRPGAHLHVVKCTTVFREHSMVITVMICSCSQQLEHVFAGLAQVWTRQAACADTTSSLCSACSYRCCKMRGRAQSHLSSSDGFTYETPSPHSHRTP